MPLLSVINTSQPDFSPRWQQLLRQLSLETMLLEGRDKLTIVREIIDSVRRQGDTAIAEYTAKFDKVNLKPDEFRINPEVLRQAHQELDQQLITALRQSVKNVRDYQQAIKVQNKPDWTVNGATLGLRYRPLQRVGVCVPGASAPLVSTVIMTAVPAQVAGVQEIAIVTSPSYQGSIHPAILAVCYELGIEEVYRVSGVQAVAALALGTKTIAKVDKIVGPSNVWAQLAKKELFGLVDIDSFAGPSDVLIIADQTARPDWVAADLLSQAEHAPGSAILVTNSSELAVKVAVEVDKQLSQLSRGELTRSCVQESCLAVVTKDLDEAVDLANEFAAEHLQIQCQNSGAIAERIINAGAIFIGPHSPVAVGDYYAGPSHTLPVGGSARIFSALNVNDFLKQSSIISYNESALYNAAAAIDTIAQAEGLDAHANSVKIRLR
jgi:histidinol dehydrogenase